jgi:hypothetical protein
MAVEVRSPAHGRSESSSLMPCQGRVVACSGDEWDVSLRSTGRAVHSGCLVEKVGWGRAGGRGFGDRGAGDRVGGA